MNEKLLPLFIEAISRINTVLGEESDGYELMVITNGDAIIVKWGGTPLFHSEDDDILEAFDSVDLISVDGIIKYLADTIEFYSHEIHRKGKMIVDGYSSVLDN